MAGMPDPLTDIPPPSRFDPDDLNNFASSPVDLCTKPLMLWAPWARNLLQSGALEPRLLLLSLSNVGSHLLHHIPNKRILGSIVLPEVSMVNNQIEPSPHNKECYLFTVDPEASVVLVLVQYTISPERASMWAKTLFGVIRPDRVLMLGAISSHHFRGKISADEPLLFLLESSEQKKADKDQLAVAPYYPSGSLVDGVAAALITHCQIRGLKARLLMSWPDTDFSVVRQMSSALSVLCKQALPKLLGLDFITAGKSTVGKKIQADSELYM